MSIRIHCDVCGRFIEAAKDRPAKQEDICKICVARNEKIERGLFTLKKKAEVQFKRDLAKYQKLVVKFIKEQAEETDADKE